jgi:cellulose synthase/poly-beta-1,6-N-acetylglucosamine synthase-like glycosyltransferase
MSNGHDIIAAMSNIRILGVVLGLSLAFLALLYFRGPRWSRGNFVIAAFVAAALLIVSIDPGSVNVLRDMLAFGQFEYGRMLAVLVLSTIVLFALMIYTKSKVDALSLLLDRYMRADVLQAVAGPAEAPVPNGIAVIIPALNEADNLRVLLPRIPKTISGLPVSVLVVNDGSTDDTREVALANGCWVAEVPVNRGQGAASRIGYGFLIKHKLRVGVTMDADNQHQPTDIARMIEPVVAGQCDLVIGSRILGSSESESRTRFLGVLLFSNLVSLLSGVKITDCSSGFKAFNVAKMSELDLRQDQFQSSEVLIASAKKGLRIKEVPIHIGPRGHGVSRKGGNFYYALFFLKAVARTWWR